MGPFDFLSGGSSEPLDPYRQPSMFEPTGTTQAGVFSPFGMIGRMMGVPSTGERLGVIEGQALNTLGKLVEEGSSPEQALVRFMQMPEGQKFFGAPGVNFQGTMEKFKSIVTAPPPTVMTAGPGQTSQGIDRSGKTVSTLSVPSGPSTITTGPGQTSTQVGPDGKPQFTQSVPQSPVNTPAGTQTTQFDAQGNPIRTIKSQTTDMQNFEGFRSIADLSAEALQDIAYMHTLPPEMRQSKQAERQMQVLIDQHGLDPKWGRKLLVPGLIEIKEDKNAYGEGVGSYTMIDKSDPANPITITPKAPTFDGRFRGQPQSTITPDMVDPNGKLIISRMDPKTTMFLGSGPAAMTNDFFARVAEGIDPAFIPGEGSTGDIVQRQRVHQRAFQNALLNLSERSSDLGTPAALVKSLQNMAEGTGFWDSPKVAYNSAINLHKDLSDSIATERYSIDNDKTMPITEKKKQAQRIDAYERVLKTLPPIEDMRQVLQAYQRGEASTPGLVATAGKAFTSTTDMVKKVLSNTRTELRGKQKGTPKQGDTADAPAATPDLPAPARAMLTRAPDMQEGDVLKARESMSSMSPAVQAVVGPVLANRAKELLQPTPTPKARPASAPPRTAPGATPPSDAPAPLPFAEGGKTGVQPFPGVNIPLINSQNPRTPFEPHSPNREPEKKKPSPFYRKKAKE